MATMTMLSGGSRNLSGAPEPEGSPLWGPIREHPGHPDQQVHDPTKGGGSGSPPPAPSGRVREFTEPSSMDHWGGRFSDPAVAGLPAAGREALKDYVFGRHQEVNDYLRGVTGQALTPKGKEAIAALDTALAGTSTPGAVVAYRAIRDTDPIAGRAPGETTVDPGYGSTTLNRNIAEALVHGRGGTPAMMRITVPAGTRALYLETNVSPRGEYELLLARGAEYQVTGSRTESIKGRDVTVYDVSLVRTGAAGSLTEHPDHSTGTGQEVHGGGRPAIRKGKIRDKRGDLVPPPREFYRGQNPGDTRRIATGSGSWDSALFAADNPGDAGMYGRAITRIKAKPEAVIAYEGTKEFRALGVKPDRKTSMLDYATQVAEAARKAGYDAVWFLRQSDVGTAILNPDAFEIGEPSLTEAQKRWPKGDPRGGQFAPDGASSAGPTQADNADLATGAKLRVGYDPTPLAGRPLRDAADLKARREKWDQYSPDEQDAIADAPRTIPARMKGALSELGDWKDGQSLTDRVNDADTKGLLMSDTAQALRGAVARLEEGLTAAGASEADARHLGRQFTDLMLAQDIETQGRSLGDHGIQHLLGDSEVAIACLEANATQAGRSLGTQAAVMLTAAYHDAGYLTPPSRAMNDNRHKEWSAQWLASDKETMGALERTFGSLSDTMLKTVKNHDGRDFDFDKNPFTAAFQVADNLAVFGREKAPPLVRYNPGAMTVYGKLEKGQITEQQAQTELRAKINANPSLPKPVRERMLAASSEVTSSWAKFNSGMKAGELDGVGYADQGDGKRSTVFFVKRTPGADTIQKAFGTGEKQWEKLAKSLGRTPDDLWDDGVMDFGAFRVAINDGRNGRPERSIWSRLVGKGLTAARALWGPLGNLLRGEWPELLAGPIWEHPGHGDQKVHGRRGGRVVAMTPSREAKAARAAMETVLETGVMTREQFEAIARHALTRTAPRGADGSYSFYEARANQLRDAGAGAPPEIVDSLPPPSAGNMDAYRFQSEGGHARYMAQDDGGRGPWGSGCLGGGVYAAPPESAEAWRGYARSEHVGELVATRIRIKKGARVVDDVELARMQSRIEDAMDNNVEVRAVYKKGFKPVSDEAGSPWGAVKNTLADSGALAAVLGYDAIRGHRFSEYIILNRGATVVARKAARAGDVALPPQRVEYGEALQGLPGGEKSPWLD